MMKGQILQTFFTCNLQVGFSHSYITKVMSLAPVKNGTDGSIYPHEQW